ncbi:hypothetical protein D1825_07975 [Cellulomonas rhizosphaerae]|uniref:Glycoside-hydrolase family GH114 TIM-barrel domain-containing protein n=1 Tax=Cellulomonas rhizosphaerae TaxID=2293719 RepID=A0A413RMG1_9CELL|nr:hypothetical protein D1825_07975 [Cellulomonas rhizosphaerae]
MHGVVRAERWAAVALAGVLLLAGCDAAPAVDAPQQTAAATVGEPLAKRATHQLRLPPHGAVVDYQIGWGYRPPAGIGGVVRDVTDVPAPGMWSACYVNGFQTQPADRRTWLRKHPNLVLRDAKGKPVSDPDWPDEMLLDTSTAKKRAAIAKVVGVQVKRCAKRGFDAVELDNLNSWTRSHGRLRMSGAIDLAKRLVAVGHAAGLAVAQKNGSELGSKGRDKAGFDFAITEECVRYDECSAYTKVYSRVLDVEYDTRRWSKVCADRQRPSSTVLRDHDLRTPGQAGYVFKKCRARS